MMNERIKELARQTGIIDVELLNDSQSKMLEKFAKLIILECIEVCDQVYTANYPDAESFERSEEGDAIKEHFGVE
jgi:hypothetical protein